MSPGARSSARGASAGPRECVLVGERTHALLGHIRTFAGDLGVELHSGGELRTTRRVGNVSVRALPRSMGGVWSGPGRGAAGVPPGRLEAVAVVRMGRIAPARQDWSGFRCSDPVLDMGLRDGSLGPGSWAEAKVGQRPLGAAREHPTWVVGADFRVCTDDGGYRRLLRWRAPVDSSQPRRTGMRRFSTCPQFLHLSPPAAAQGDGFA